MRLRSLIFPVLFSMFFLGCSRETGYGSEAYSETKHKIIGEWEHTPKTWNSPSYRLSFRENGTVLHEIFREFENEKVMEETMQFVVHDEKTVTFGHHTAEKGGKINYAVELDNENQLKLHCYVDDHTKEQVYKSPGILCMTQSFRRSK